MAKGKKGTSIRIDTEVLAKVDSFSAKHYYWSRSHVIESIVKCVMHDFNERQIYDMVSRCANMATPVETEFRFLDLMNE